MAVDAEASATRPAASLVLQQQQLRAAIVSPDRAVATGLLRKRDTHGAADEAEPLLRIYQHAYAARLVAALRDNFGVLPLAMGDAAFDALAAAYLAAHPSRQPSIRWFGHRLVEFMATRHDLVPHPAFTDLARMEWALRQAFDAADAESLTVADVAAKSSDDWPAWVLRFHPSVQCLPLAWQIEPAWRALQGGDGTDGDLPEPQEAAHALRVWRLGLQTHWRAMNDPLEARLLNAALGGEPFERLCAMAAQELGDEAAAPAAVAALQGWIADGLLVG